MMTDDEARLLRAKAHADLAQARANLGVVEPDPLDAFTLAVSTPWLVPPAGAGFDDRWRMAFVAGRIAEALAQLHDGRALREWHSKDRGDLRQMADEFVERVLNSFTPEAQP